MRLETNIRIVILGIWRATLDVIRHDINWVKLRATWDVRNLRLKRRPRI